MERRKNDCHQSHERRRVKRKKITERKTWKFSVGKNRSDKKSLEQLWVVGVFVYYCGYSYYGKFCCWILNCELEYWIFWGFVFWFIPPSTWEGARRWKLEKLNDWIFDFNLKVEALKMFIVVLRVNWGKIEFVYEFTMIAISSRWNSMLIASKNFIESSSKQIGLYIFCVMSSHSILTKNFHCRNKKNSQRQRKFSFFSWQFFHELTSSCSSRGSFERCRRERGNFWMKQGKVGDKNLQVLSFNIFCVLLSLP